MRFILADTETTGVGATDKVCELAYHEIDENFQTIFTGYSLINPGIPIAPGASAVNGITNAMVADAPTIEQYMAEHEFPLIGEDVVLVAHNAPFDFRYLAPHMSPDAQTICTLRCARLLYPDADNHKQGTLAYTLGLEISHERAHSADGDLDVLLQLLKRICADLGCGIGDLLEYQKRPRPISKISFGKHKNTLLKDLDSGYVKWLLKLDNLDPDMRVALEAL